MEIGKESNHELVVFGGDTELKCRYTLPGDPTSDVYILPVSGGADSTALAILMHRLNPNVSFKLMFSDTGAEDPEIYQCLDRLEVYLGRKIERIMPPKNMWALLDKFGGYLPSATERWCTRLVKAEPFKIWLKQFDSQTKWVFVGIRADEQTRVAFTLDGVSTEMPFIDMGWRRQDVFRLLQESIGIPRFYSRKRLYSALSVCLLQPSSISTRCQAYQHSYGSKGFCHSRLLCLASNDKSTLGTNICCQQPRPMTLTNGQSGIKFDLRFTTSKLTQAVSTLKAPV